MPSKDHKNHQDQNSDHNTFSNNESNQNKCDTLEDGTAAFLKWMSSSDKKSLTSENPIVLIKIVNGNNTVLYDTGMLMPVLVKLIDGVLFCDFCKSDECAHVGFTIRLNQLVNRGHGNEKTIEDVIADWIDR
ncbi:MAG TPA: hypothetical protein VJ772_04420 [Nitrososphaeraceae archaeon]|nr:hypothetical protein [Nitrososphaeraceae archaeon]